MNYHLNTDELNTIVSALYFVYIKTHDESVKQLFNKIYDLNVHSSSEHFNIEEILP